MQASPFSALRRAWSRNAALLPALVVAVPALAWIREGASRASLTTLGRDQGIFQYIGWALLQGDRDYVDVRDVNGPLTHAIHALFLRLGGADEHRFHVLDLAVTLATFALVGACLPGAAALRATRHGMFARLGWALAGAVVLGAQYLGYIYWDLAQRESFCDWFLLPSVGLQLVAQRAWTVAGTRPRAGRWLALSGALSAIAWFGKPTFVAFSLVQTLALVVDRDVPVSTTARLARFFGGMLVTLVAGCALLAARGDLAAFLRISFVDVPTMYRFMWPRTVSEILALPWCAVPAALSLVTSAVVVGLVWDRQMHARMLALGLLPLVALAGVIAQAKGFPYHFHPLTASLHLQWLAIVAWAWDRFGARVDPLARLLPMGLAAGLAGRAATLAALSPHVTATWLIDDAANAEQRQTEAYFDHFAAEDFHPFEMRQAAEYLQAHTRATDRVQLYAMDPYVLFLARRRSATPYIYAYDLDADAALHGAFSERGLRPNTMQSARIRALRDAHEQDLVERLAKDPPAAFLFIDKSPLMTFPDAVYDFREHNPTAREWFDGRYVETATFGVEHVFLRRDIADALPSHEAPTPP